VSNRPSIIGRDLLPIIAVFALSLVTRLYVVWAVPHNFSFDGYQRWAGREHILVQDWLPATQALIYAIESLGGDINDTRIVLAMIASLAAAMGAALAGACFGNRAAWWYLPFAVFYPFLTWSTVPYQEGTYLLLLFSALVAFQHHRVVLADLCIGALCLVRYEAWAIAVLWLMIRRDPKAIIAMWGILIWTVIRVGFDGVGHAASPIDFADWNGLLERTSPRIALTTLTKLGHQLLNSAGWSALLMGGIGGLWALKSGTLVTRFIVVTVMIQVAAIFGWMLGLETAIERMQVIVVMTIGVLATHPLVHMSKKTRWIGIACGVAAVWVSMNSISYSVYAAKRSVNYVKPEMDLAAEMIQCGPTCRWSISPRDGLGTRSRHDGCEVIQGVTEYRHGHDFICETWAHPSGFQSTHTAVWSRGKYLIRHRL